MELSDKENNSLNIMRITWFGAFINLVLSLIKFVVGYIGESQAVIADAVHSLSDIVTDFAVIIGVKFWNAPPDEKHPYGHHRIETIITTAIGLLLMFVALSIGYNSIVTIKEAHYNSPKWIAIIGPILSVIFKEVIYQLTVKVGKQTQSQAVIANAWHHRSDALSSLPAIIAVAIASINPSWNFVDHIGAVIVSLFILKVSWGIIFPAFSQLIDQGASVSDYILIEEVALSVDGVMDVHKIRTRKISSNIFVDLHVLVDPNISVKEGHFISENVAKQLVKQIPDIVDVITHLEPFEK